MKTRFTAFATLFVVIALCRVPASFSQESRFTEAFNAARQAAEKDAMSSRSVVPILKLFDEFKTPVEVAELEMLLGQFYNQRTGFVDPAQAVVHLSKALEYDLPERTRMQALMWRSGSQEQLKKYDEALKDLLRYLLMCSYHDLSGGYPPIEAPKVPIFSGSNSNNPENVERIKDYNSYREQISFQSDMLWGRYAAIEGIRRLQKNTSKTNVDTGKVLEQISPDASRHKIIMQWLNSENKNPNP